MGETNRNTPWAWRMATHGACAATLSVALLCGCQVYDPALVGGDSGPVGGCENPRTPPDRPATTTEGEDTDEIIFFLRQVVLDQSGGA